MTHYDECHFHECYQCLVSIESIMLSVVILIVTAPLDRRHLLIQKWQKFFCFKKIEKPSKKILKGACIRQTS
jgi:hypothetical protein